MTPIDAMDDRYYACPECQVGIMDLAYVTYLTFRGGEMITVPNFPAWICDVCGRRAYDPDAVSWLNILLNVNSKRKSAKPSGPRHRSDEPSSPTVSE
jgi:YgiT-type zinc finger domain-containing protein